jgi:hypothetical protein
MPHDHKKALCTFPTSTPELAAEAIEHALKAQPEWETMPFNDRAAIFLRVRTEPSRYLNPPPRARMLTNGCFVPARLPT